MSAKTNLEGNKLVAYGVYVALHLTLPG